MKLNADIVKDNLSGSYTVEINGPKSTELCLERPILFTDDLRELSDNHLYVAIAERLPNRMSVGSNVVIVCIGDAPQLTFYQMRCCVLSIKTNAELFRIHNLIQSIYNRYDEWQERLMAILDRNASIDEMLQASASIFENPMFVIDSNFHFLAHTRDAASETRLNDFESGNLGLDKLGQFLELHEPSMHVKEPLLFRLLDTETLNMNLFEMGTYIGCLTIDYRLRKHRESDIPLGKTLARMIELALQKFSGILTDTYSIIRKVLQDVVDGMPVDYEHQRMVAAAQNNKNFICVKMKLSNRFAKLPLGYICNRAESVFPGSIAFERKGNILCFIEMENTKEQLLRAQLRERLALFIDTMDLRIGVSDSFSDLFSARLYYHQASAALENGTLVRPNDKYYVFQDYALIELVINSLGRLPTELFFTDGMRRLASHDAESSVSYMETLLVYLNNNMNITKTANDLYVHRSTLLERIARIERELESDLQDSDERLRIQLLLKAMKIHEIIQCTPTVD